MLVQGISYKHILLHYDPIKVIQLEPSHFNLLQIFVDLYDKKGFMLKVGEVLNEVVKFSYIHSHKECYSAFNTLYDRHLVKRKLYGTKGKFKYMPASQGRLLVKEFIECYGTFTNVTQLRQHIESMKVDVNECTEIDEGEGYNNAIDDILKHLDTL